MNTTPIPVIPTESTLVKSNKFFNKQILLIAFVLIVLITTVSLTLVYTIGTQNQNTSNGNNGQSSIDEIMQTETAASYSIESLRSYVAENFNYSFKYNPLLGKVTSYTTDTLDSKGNSLCMVERLTFSSSKIEISLTKGIPDCQGAVGDDLVVENQEITSLDYKSYSLKVFRSNSSSKVSVFGIFRSTTNQSNAVLIRFEGSGENEVDNAKIFIAEIITHSTYNDSLMKSIIADKVTQIPNNATDGIVQTPTSIVPNVSLKCSLLIYGSAKWDSSILSQDGFYIDIDDNNNWDDGFWNKYSPSLSVYSTDIPNGFAGIFGKVEPLTFKSNAEYFVRVYFVSTKAHTQTVKFTTPNCQTADINKLVENGNLLLKGSDVIKGIIDLYYKNYNGEWELYNNIVPIVKVNGVWNNAEIDQIGFTIKKITSASVSSPQLLEFDYSKFPNGASFKVTATINNGTKEIKFEVQVKQDSASIEAISLGNYYGLDEFVDRVSSDGILKITKDSNFLIGNTLNASAFAGNPSITNNKPNFLVQGQFIFFDTYNQTNFTGNKVTFWNESKRIAKTSPIQFQKYNAKVESRDELVLEVRQIPWLESQLVLHPDYGKLNPTNWSKWFETIHLTRLSPYTQDRLTWIFGIE